jgi:threonine/homoserine/homoserine lactone efflux protein
VTPGHALLSFAVVAGLLTLTPGLDTALILRTAAVRGPRQAWGVVAGIQTGCLVWGLSASAGATAVLLYSHAAYEVLRWAGAAYLVAMGVRMIWGAAGRSGGADGTDVDDGGATVGHRFVVGWRRGLMTNVLNPKIGVFYVALLPPFIPAGVPTLPFGLLLTSVHVGMGVIWSAVLVGLARRLRRVLRRPAVRRSLDRITGTVITGFGLRLAIGSH